MYHWIIRNDTLHSSLYPTSDGQRILQMCQDHSYIKLEPIGMRLSRTNNVSGVDLQDHQRLHEYNGPIGESMDLVEELEKI
jgi:hypothetical protein